VATAATLTSATVGLDSLLGGRPAQAQTAEDSQIAEFFLDSRASAADKRRREQAFQKRENAANAEKRVPIPSHAANGDEQLYSNYIGNYSKGLPHDSSGEVNPSAYQTLLKAVKTGKPADFDAIPLGGTVLLVDPQSGLAFDVEGTDSHQLAIPASPALASAQRAGEAVENYWQALLRDVPFSSYGRDAGVALALQDLNKLSDFRGPKQSNQVTSDTIFRGFTQGDVIGPYVSQFFCQAFTYGAAPISQQFRTYVPGVDYMTDSASWMNVQNGVGPFGSNQIDPNVRYLRDGRDLAAWVHVDVLFQAYFDACVYLLDVGAPFNPGNPYLSSKNQTGFGTFGWPHISALVAEVATRALKAVWYQKWFVHRALRPEEYGGLVNNTVANGKNYPLHSDVLNSDAIQTAFSLNGTYLLPIAFPEGCPQHPSYGAGHATVAGACTAILKAFFDETFVIPNPVVASEDGFSVNPYTGADADQMTVGGELDKLAANVAIGRNFAGVHWRSDYQESLLLGEAVAISVLRDSKPCYNENFSGFTFTKFDGTKITV